MLSRNSMMGCRTLSASWATLLALPTFEVPFTWDKMSPICFTFSSIWGWKLHKDSKRVREDFNPVCQSEISDCAGFQCVFVHGCMCVSITALLPDCKDPAEIIHDIVELNLQILQDIAGLHTQLKHIQRNTCTQAVGVIKQGSWKAIMTLTDTFGFQGLSELGNCDQIHTQTHNNLSCE